jgi:DNA-binding NarL/FixJ family response regulator
MTQQTDRNKLRVVALVSLGLLSLGAAVYYVNKNYDVRLVRTHAEDPTNTADSAQSARPAPIIVRLACAKTASAMSSLKAPSRSLRQQLRQADPRTPVPLPNMRCKQTAGL